MNAKRCLQFRQRPCPFAGGNVLGHEAVAGDVVAQQHDDVGTQRVGHLDDGTDAFRRHPRAAGVDVRERGNRQLEARGPALKLQIVARDPGSGQRFDKRIGSGERPDRSEPAEPLQELSTRDHGPGIAMK